MVVSIVVDERERASEVPSFLKTKDVRVDFSTMEVGDYIVSPEVAVERKTVHDFVMSIYDGRLFEQVHRLNASFSKPVLVVEGSLEEIREVSANPNSIFGAMANLALNQRLTVVPSAGAEDTASILYFMAKQAQGAREDTPLLPRVRKARELSQVQLSVIGALPGVGPKLAFRLLEHFGTPRRVLSASRSELARVEGVGWARAGKVEAVLTASFRAPPKEAE